MTTFQSRPEARTHHNSADLVQAAWPLLARLNAQLQSVAPLLLRHQSSASRWGAPPVFFLNEPNPEPPTVSPTYSPALLRERRKLLELMEDALCLLMDCISCRHLARALPGFWSTILRLAPWESTAKNLASVLAVTDDLVLRVILPQSRQGVRVKLAGMRDLGEFQHHLLSQLVDAELRQGFPGEWQFFRPAALCRDGELPQDVRACDDWFWGSERFEKIPVDADGERTLLLGPAVVRTTWDSERSPRRLTADLELLEVLTRSQVLNYLRSLTGLPWAEPLRQVA